MVRIFRIVVALSLATQCVHAVVPSSGVQTRVTLPHVEAQLLVKLNQGAVAADTVQILAAFGAQVLGQIDAGDLVLVGIDQDANLGAAIALAALDPRVAFAEPNFVHATLARPNDLDFSQQWAKDNRGVNAPMGLGAPGADLNLVAAWDERATAPDVVLSIIDDAVETSHVDLFGNVLPTGRCFASPGSARPCSRGANDPDPIDENDFHGTLVAGTAGARGNNGIGIAGSAWQVGLLPLKVDLSIYAIVQAVDEALAQDADIINMSFGGPGNSAALDDAIGRARDADVLVVAAAGNADASNDHAVHFPSDSLQPNVLSIAASNAADQLAGFSQWGSLTVDLAAPGEQVLTTALGNGYARVNGTSFAAPHVAGVAALLHAQNGGGYANAIAALLHGGVDGVTTIGPVVPGQDKRAIPGRVASGRLDAARALSGPSGGVILIDTLTVDDTVSGNGNGELDSGETAQLAITLRNVGLAEAGVSGILSTPDSGALTINQTTPVLFGTLARNGTASATFSVTSSAGSGDYSALFLQLDLSAAGAVALPSRYAYLDTGTLRNGVTLTQSIQRWDWDEFHALHVDVPAGATQLRVTTSGSGDVDLLLRYAQPPAYLITLDAAARGVDGFYYVDAETLVSGQSGANEAISVNRPLPGTYYVVVVNYDQAPKDYSVTASYVDAGSDVITFNAASYTVSEAAGSVNIEVFRSGSVGAASARLRTTMGTAASGSDYDETDVTVAWAAGESGVKMVNVALINDAIEETTETFSVTLADVTGAAAGTPESVTVTINDDDAPTSTDPPPVPPISSAGGGGAPSLLFLVVLGLVLGRRRR